MAAAVLRSCVASEVVSTVFSRPKRSGKREKKSQKTSFLGMIKFLTRSVFHKLLLCFTNFFLFTNLFFFKDFLLLHCFPRQIVVGQKISQKTFLEMSNFWPVSFLQIFFVHRFFTSFIFSSSFTNFLCFTSYFPSNYSVIK